MSTPASRLKQVTSHFSTLTQTGGGASEKTPLILYDIMSKNQPMAWSPNVWKTRLVLNHKKIPYKTKWISYPDIKTTLLSLGFGPSAISRNGSSFYTLPAIYDPPAEQGGKPTLLVDSLAIAEYLDARYPSSAIPPLFPAGSEASISLFVKHTQSNILPHLVQLVVPLVHQILDDRGAEFFERTRRPMFSSKNLKDVLVDAKEREEVWAKLFKEFDLLDSHLRKNEGGLFWMGEHVSYPDILLVAFFMWMERANSDRDPGFKTAWDVMKGWNGGRWEKLVNKFDLSEP